MTRYTVNRYGVIEEKPTTEFRPSQAQAEIGRALVTAMQMGLIEDPTRTTAQVAKKPTMEPSKTRVHTSTAIRRALATAEELGLVAPSSVPKEKVREPMVGGWLPPAQHVERYSQMWSEMQESKP